MAAKVSPSRFVERSIATAKRSPPSAARTLFKELLAGNSIAPLAEPQWEILSALADRATAVRAATPPGTAAIALGDGWFQCPRCEDVFEGEACRACKPSAPAVELVFDDARIWLRPSSAESLAHPGRLSYLASAFAWLRVESGERWFELVDDPEIVLAKATARAVLPPNLVPIGVHHDGTIVLAHETKLALFTVDERGTVTEIPDRIACAGELIVRQIAVVLSKN